MQINPILISIDEDGENGHIQILYVASPSYVQRGIYKYYMLFFLTYAHQSAHKTLIRMLCFGSVDEQ